MGINDLITIKDPKSPISEAYRTLRTNVLFSSVDEQLKAIVITSSGPGEGKTTSSANLAVVLSQGDKKVLLMDCDLRKPKVHKMFKLSNQSGLSNILVGEAEFDSTVHKTEIENLHVLTSGIRPPNPSELLSSSKMKSFLRGLREKYDFIILDTPPVIMVTDAQILSQYADGSILVVSSGEAEREAVIQAKKLLEKVAAKIIGVILNKLDTSRKGHYGYYYQYYYGADGEKVKKASKASRKK